MSPTRSFSSLVIAGLFCSSAFAAPWIITEYNQGVPATYYHVGDDLHDTAHVSTRIEAITPTVTSLPEALSTVTQYNSYLYQTEPYETVVQVLYPSGVGEPADYNYQEDYYHSTIFVVDLTYTAPTGCASDWTTTTSTTVTVPDATIEALLPRTKTSASISINTDSAFRPTTYTYDYVWVNPTQLPSSSLASLRDTNFPTALYTADSCAYTANSGVTYSTNSGYYGGYYGDYYYDYYGISPLAILLISVLGWIVLWFLLGIIESWVRFRRLMLGWQTRRGLPVCWCMTLLPISLCCLFGFRKGFRARNAADAAILKQRWDKMSAWRKFSLFWIWGFRYKYPTVLGPAPLRVKASKRPGKEVAPPLLQGSPPQTAEGERGASVSAGDPEMGLANPQPVPLQPIPRAFVPRATGALRTEEIGRAHSC
ncbi:hypothetical protein N7532_001229 [Penicillium argentinense]|uniref:Uncharacterized protein n=1 Tax=Penicillium argentinense TaxID=1131581 RepID=A0A9W9G233_9EURO|nr:uncharacterized protein N7532_001229 [Penicillium argentinense]KAJ5110694.1 hypothetical protein N7532_001229 [Penicillium argentinense]